MENGIFWGETFWRLVKSIVCRLYNASAKLEHWYTPAHERVVVTSWIADCNGSIGLRFQAQRTRHTKTAIRQCRAMPSGEGRSVAASSVRTKQTCR
jgi:hypothetical protein